MIGLGFEFLCAAFAFVAILAAGAVVLRSAVGLANRMIGPTKVDAPIGWDWDEEEDDEPVELDQESAAIPTPSLGAGMLVMLLAGLVHLVIGFGLRFVLTIEGGRDRSDDWLISAASHLIGLGAGFVVLLGLLSSLLPTTPRRAALAVLIFYLLLLAIALMVSALIFVVSG